MNITLYEVLLIDTFTPSVSGSIIKKTVIVDICQEGLCHEGEVPDLMALKTACDVGNFMRKHFNRGGMYQLQKSMKIVRIQKQNTNTV